MLWFLPGALYQPGHPQDDWSAFTPWMLPAAGLVLLTLALCENRQPLKEATATAFLCGSALG